jgi:hypothetical protein
MSLTTTNSKYRVQTHVGSEFYFASGRLAYPVLSLNSHSISGHYFLLIFFSPFRQARQCRNMGWDRSLLLPYRNMLHKFTVTLFQSLANTSVSTASCHNWSNNIMSHPDFNVLCCDAVFLVVPYNGMVGTCCPRLHSWTLKTVRNHISED